MVGEAVLLQAACHNPTGADLSLAQWDEVAAIIARRNLMPLIDVAYHAIAQSVDVEMAGAQRVIATVPEALVAISMSKTFGV